MTRMKQRIQSRHSNGRYKNKKAPVFTSACSLGDFGGIRTLDPLIKSQLLYQLSYETEAAKITKIFNRVIKFEFKIDQTLNFTLHLHGLKC